MTQTRRTRSSTSRSKAATSRSKATPKTRSRGPAQARPSRAIQARKNATTKNSRRTPVRNTKSQKKRRRSKRGYAGGSREFVILASLVVGLSLLGITMVLSASSVVSLTTTGNPWGEFTSQAVWLALGTGVAIAATAIDYRLLLSLIHI